MASVAIIGGGLTGLTAAYRLQCMGLKPRVFEGSDRLGGRVKTIRSGEFSFDVGASGLLGSYAETAELARELGLAGQLQHGPVKAAVLRDGALHVLDTSKLLKTLGTRLLSFREKLGLLKLMPAMMRAWKKLDFENEGRAADLDREDVAAFCRRTSSPGVTEYLIGPILRALWQRDPPKIPAIDLLWSLKHFAPSMYVLDGGMDLLTASLEKRVDAQLNAAVSAIYLKDDGVHVHFLTDQGEKHEIFDRCIIATPPMIVTSIFKDLPPDVENALAKLTYGCSVNVHFGLSGKICPGLQMILPPEKESADITTVVFEDEKGRGRCAEGKSAISLFFRDDWSRPRLSSGNNAVIAEAIELAKQVIPGFEEKNIEVSHVERWPLATMSKQVGDTKYINDVSEYNKNSRSVFLAGDYFAPSGVNTAIVSGNRAAQQVLESLER